ncbi:hypothetical protein ACP70R_001993 [Stipagrostis hirtigluma subsp. patula]
MDADRLSALPDRALTRVLSFLDLRRATRVGMLSRRWRALWRQTDVLNLRTRPYDGVDYDGERVGRLLFRDALAAVLAAGRCPVRKLNVLVSSYYQSDYLESVMSTSPGMDDVLAAPAMQCLEELRFKMEAEFCQTGDEYVLPLRRLPCQSLRVLSVAGCTLGPAPPPGTAGFRRLETLRLVSCHSSPENLQAMLDAVPNLRTLWLEYVSFRPEEPGINWYDVMSKLRVRLRCRAAMVAVALIHCHDTDGLDLDAPNVQYLRYKGFLQHFPFTSATQSGVPANLRHAELSFCTERWCCNYPSGEFQPNAFFWESIGRFRRLRVLKLKLLDFHDIAVHQDQEDMLLKVFPDLELLEVEGSCEVDSHGAEVMIANLLHCCPALQEFRLKFEVHGDLYAQPKRAVRHSEERGAQLGLEKSMDSLARLKSKKTGSPSSPLADDDMDLCVLKERLFPCLDGHLRRIRLEFQLERFKCFEVKLAKFLVENAIVLEEMEVHDGDQRVYDHIHHKLAQWRANSFRSRTNIVGRSELRVPWPQDAPGFDP